MVRKFSENSSFYSHSFSIEMWLANLLHKGRTLNQTVVPSEQVLRMVNFQLKFLYKMVARQLSMELKLFSGTTKLEA